MVNRLLIPVLSTPHTQDFLCAGDVYQLLHSEVLPEPVKLVRRRSQPLSFADMRRCLMQDFLDGALAAHPVHAARAAFARTEELNLWPNYPSGWLHPFGQFLIDLAPLLDEPGKVLGLPGVAEALRMREVRM